MSMSRVTALGASFVWSVERTRCPVSDAWIAISAVSRSRISPISTTSGILPHDRAQRRRERESRLLVHLHLDDSRQRYSIGSSTVTMFTPRSLRRRSAA